MNKFICYTALAVLVSLNTQSVRAVSSMAMGYTPAYPVNFANFKYVNPGAPKGGLLKLSGFGTFDTLNPFLLKGISADGLGTLVFESLVEKSLDEPFSVYGLLAEDMRLAEDELSVTFRLNPKARFSNGKKVTAADVKFSFDTLTGKSSHPQFRFYYADVKQAVVLDSQTIRFDFKNKNRELHLIVGDISVFSRDWLQGKPFDKVTDVKPVASGPYVVKDYSLDKQVRFERNPNYWAKDLPVRKGMFNFDEVVFKYYKDRTIALEAFKSGEFDFFFENHSKRWARDHVGPKYESGELIKKEVKHKNNAGMQGFVMNLRRGLFKDVKVRKALTLAFDFEWANSHLFYNQYVRNSSYFSNSELEATGLPVGDELEMLNRFKDSLPIEVFTINWRAPSTLPPGSLRQNLRAAKKLLEKAGWSVVDNALVNASGKKFEIEFLLVQKGFERIIAPYARSLKKLGISVFYRTVDASLFKRRLDKFDFDMVVTSFPQSMSPGNELKTMFHSASANLKGSRNLPGIDNPVVDELVESIINAPDRKHLVTYTHALDRVLLAGEYIVPNWYIDKHRIVYRDKFGVPATTPLYFEPLSWLQKTWWHK